MFYRSLLFIFILSCSSSLFANNTSGGYEVIELYTQDELNNLIKKNQHLKRIKQDECQLVEDIEAHALKIKEPSYVYLWGDMLAWGVCVERDAELGLYYIEESAKQGLLAAIEQLGRYYEKGILVQVDKDRAVVYYREAALQGFLNAQLNYVKMLNEGFGSPVDYEDAYTALFHSVITNKTIKKEAEKSLSTLAQKMPEYIVKRARIAQLQ